MTSETQQQIRDTWIDKFNRVASYIATSGMSRLCIEHDRCAIIEAQLNHSELVNGTGANA